MNKYWSTTSKLFNQRNSKERIIACLIIAALIINFWLILVEDKVNAEQNITQREIASLNRKISEQKIRFQQIQQSQSFDPNLQAKTTISELQASTLTIDEELSQLYKELILPKEMAIVLTNILQRETHLKLVSVENLPSENILSTDIQSAVPLVGRVEDGILSQQNNELGVRVFRHGLEMKFIGNFLDTVLFLRSLEALDSSFIWEDFVFDLDEYPNANVSFKIFTLSTQKEWIGV